MSRLVMLSGPSCIGKGPMIAALKRFHPEVADRLKTLVLYNDRAQRVGEMDGVEYHFRRREEIEALRKDPGYIVVEARDDLQALELAVIQQIMDEGYDPLFEGNPYVVQKLREAGLLERFATLTVFLSPLSRQELLYLKVPERRVDLSRFVADIQRRKLMNRTRRQKIDLSLSDLQDIERRATAALAEMREAAHYDHVIPLYDGEGDDNWDTYFYPIGSARLALEAFAALLRGETPALVEEWEDGLVP